MKNVMMAACLALTTTPVSAGSIDLSDVYSSFIAFGDSLSDDGKLEGTPFEPGLPSVGGRFSNGPTFVEDVADDFAVDINLAIGGATARDANENPLPPAVGTLSGQVNTLANAIANPLTKAALGGNPLISVLMGANDILQNVGLPSDFNTLPGIGVLAADAVADGVRAIGALDPVFNTYVVANLPDLSRTPLFQNPAFGASALAPLAAFETAAFNSRLAMNIEALRLEGFTIINFDLDSLLAELQAEFSALGVDITTPCSFDLSIPGPEGTCVFSPGSPNNTDLSLAGSLFFIDGIHPNAQVHEAAAEAFREAVAAIPLPPGMLLMLSGLCAFGYVRRRTAA